VNGGEDDDDMDGLINNYENLIGTDPLDNDSDNDGLFDGEEVSIGTNPNNPSDAGTDSDSDNLTNFVEVFTYGTHLVQILLMLIPIMMD
jgi:hypothetical protein